VKIALRTHQFLLLAAVIIFLPHCNWFGGQPTPTPAPAPEPTPAPTTGAVTGGDVLLTIDGKARITTNQFEAYKQTILETQPQLKQLIALMPDAEYELFKSMKNEELLKDWVKKNNIDQKAEYKKDKQMIADFAERQLAVKYFQEAHPAKVSDADIRKFYEENKKQFPELMASRGGVKGQGISFSSAADADAFAKSAREKGFAVAAKESKAKIDEYKDVSVTSYELEAPLREKLSAVKKYPSIEVVTGKDKTYVVNVTGKTDPEYVPFDEVKQRLEMYLQQQKMAENFTQELEKLERTMMTVENKNYFDRIKQQREDEMKKVMDQEKGKQTALVSKDTPKPLKAS
jgi:hypothetical protein